MKKEEEKLEEVEERKSSYYIQKNNSKYIIDLNIRSHNIELLGESLRKSIYVTLNA